MNPVWFQKPQPVLEQRPTKYRMHRALETGGYSDERKREHISGDDF
jgi:hypothetical protein